MNFVLLLAGLLISYSTMALPPLSFSQVVPGIYLHTSAHHWPDRDNHGEIANIGFIVGEQCVAVIDSGGSPQQGLALRNTIRQVTAKPVCYVINTHVHPDHIYGNIAFKEPGVQFVGHHKLARAMATRGDHYLGRAAELLDIQVNQDNIIPPDIQVSDSMTLNLGNRELVLTAHPSAHTDNDLSVYDKATDTIWLADLLFLEHIPVIDGSIKGWLAEMGRLEKNHYKLVVPGHGHLVKDWPASMQPQKAYLTDLAAEVRAMIKQGKTLEQAVNTVGLPAKKNWQLFEQFHRKNVTIAFAELEWED
ncbi:MULTISPECIES: quinoprotein relay system zinc metallohydrolase 2 [Methylomonas]|uniref:MBL fold metallo-hydrolase n=2 Tax=Methylomonas TaxID=416 RepID=A0A140E573_9GAMM|nr:MULTISPECIES: quinoprotein relay system zinc metallohydrolase 2 [Methylomonas]AMK75547.1 MBL fold metallo-hydrolase [Methylomonas denitrificans]OAI09166.1 MBL fold metallo-hydrolase [Methylomonas methanica]TCV79043.1 quinoprotein relay system zinc metallohydrolase 2 [Methylomonas methanica]